MTPTAGGGYGKAGTVHSTGFTGGFLDAGGGETVFLDVNWVPSGQTVKIYAANGTPNGGIYDAAGNLTLPAVTATLTAGQTYTVTSRIWVDVPNSTVRNDPGNRNVTVRRVRP